MNVEAYRKTVHRRMIVMSAIGVGYIIAMIAIHVLWSGELGVTSSILNGFASGVVGVSAILVPRYRKALRDEQVLRRMWNREHDERMIAIKARAGMPMLIYMSLGMMTVALFTAQWNITATLTLLLTAVAQLLIGSIVKLICTRTM